MTAVSQAVELLSKLDRFLTPSERRRLNEIVLASKHDWRANARPKQLPPLGQWRIWLILAGRGWGKTRVGAETINLHRKMGYKRFGMIAPTAADARDVMVEGVSGLEGIAPPWDRPEYKPTKRRVDWKDGSQAMLYSGEEPNRLRGPQHEFLWGDEFGYWRYDIETYDMAMFGLRMGEHTRLVLTGTPKPTELIKMLLKDAVPYADMNEGMRERVVVTQGNTYENQSNIAADFLTELKAKYEGTRLGRQEIFAEILADNPDAIFNQSWFDDNRLLLLGTYKRHGRNRMKYVNPSRDIEAATKLVEFERVAVSVDPAASKSALSDETGIVVAARDSQFNGYLLADHSGKYTPEGWARRAVQDYYHYDADVIFAEKNNGGEMVEHTIKSVDSSVNVRLIHASKNKHTRADPISSIAEQGGLYHVGDQPRLEDQLVSFVPGEDGSDDRFDAYVHVMKELLITGRHHFFAVA